MSYVAPIVEGYGEIEAVPQLVRRIAWDNARPTPVVGPPYRVHASSFLNFDHEFKKAIGLSAGKAAANGGVVLIILDCEDGCPATLGPEIERQARNVRADVNYVVCLACREYETWFMVAAPSLAGKSGLPANLAVPPSPEKFRDAKGWLRQQMADGYTERTDQIALTAQFDLQMASNSDSFRHLVDGLRPYL